MVLDKKEVVIEGFAKINLALDIIGRLPSGYHEVSMIMQQISLHDVITIKVIEDNKTFNRNINRMEMHDLECKNASKDGIYLSTSKADLPTDDQNLAYKAAKRIKEACNIQENIAIHIEKKIPLAAGLAGGSTDAAAVLRGLNHLFQLGQSQAQLCEIGIKLGADVPFCVIGGAAIAEGIGERLTPIKGLSKEYSILLCKPSIGISTKEIYQMYADRADEMKRRFHPNINDMKVYLESGRGTLSENMANVLEYVAIEKYPVIQAIKDQMDRFMPEAVLMSGSGPTVFGVFKNRAAAESAYDALKSQYCETYLAAPL